MGRYITTTSEKIKPEGLSKTRQVYPGDLVLSNSMSFGRPYIMAVEGCIHDGWLLIRDTQNQFDPVFLCHMLGTPQMLDQYRMFASGSTVNNLNKELVGNAMVPLPDRDEQVKIGNYLDELDGLITLHQRECGKPPFNQSPAWEQRKLGELIQLGGSGGTPSANNPDYYGGDIPFLSIADINGRDITNTAKTLTDEGLQNSAAWIVPSGAVSLAMYASVGKVGIIRQDTATSQAFYNMVFDNEALRDFVFTRLEKAETDSEWEPYISTGTQRNLNADKVKSFSLDVPSNEEASEISAYFANLDTLITLHQRMCPIFSFCAHGSRTNFAQTLQGWLQILRYPRPIPKMLVSPSAPASGVFGTAKGAFICASSSAGASTSSPSARKNFITSSTLCCRESLSSP